MIFKKRIEKNENKLCISVKFISFKRAMCPYNQGCCTDIYTVLVESKHILKQRCRTALFHLSEYCKINL